VLTFVDTLSLVEMFVFRLVLFDVLVATLSLKLRFVLRFVDVLSFKLRLVFRLVLFTVLVLTLLTV